VYWTGVVDRGRGGWLVWSGDSLALVCRRCS